ncbi:cell shape-determining protein [Clostridium butyricum]|uniref:Cell shape-determining protein n=2 Tax=Clostridium butyricum TaxID=1492 RepID=A0A512TRE7_CLOBU|nr:MULTISPECIES: cell shape-determining protein [Clostridium]MCQ2013624.1 cell shape-determining protein [Clostridium butyricum]MCQ2025825.1 cell shape-determining protein [Clostridium butyricum]MDB2161074.1 cell shape-determining protein [Clostridium butyricum]MDU3581290.1 cell shape-determining protein [Clostridium butyricum]MDU3594854.1 cell shape-determining protein [Clostridium butyricum]
MDTKGNLFRFIKILIAAYLIVGILVFFNGSLVLDLSLNALTITGVFVICTLGYGFFIRNKKYMITAFAVAAVYVAVAIVCSPVANYKAHRNLIGNIEEVDFSSEIKYIDLNQLPTIDKELAGKLADKKLGEIASLGSQVTVGDLHLQSINGELYYVAPLEHSSFLKWLTNREGTEGYIKVSATNQNDVELVTELNGEPVNIKYLDSAYLFSDLRLASYLRDLKAGHTDYTFELDDTGRPYWVVTRYDNAIGISEAKAIGVLVMDAQTGQAEVYDIENAPKWIDRIQPKSFMNRYINKWGELVHGVFNFTDKDKLTTTSGMNIIYNDDLCYYYTGITSVGSDESLVGFTLTNTRTGETKLYKTSGATENASMKSAEGKVQQYGYTATFPYLINIQNEPTYFMTLKDSNGLVKQYAMVNVKNYNTVGVGDTLQGTLNKYLEGLTNTSISLEGGNKQEVITGEVERIGVVIKDGTSIYDMKLKDNDNIFQVSTETARDAALTTVGDSVEMNFIKVGSSRYIIVNSFINNSLGNVEQQQKEQEENKDVEILNDTNSSEEKNNN